MSELHVRLQMQRADFSLALDVRLPARGVTALFGPSASGKTTCLRAIAGLEPLARGYCALGGQVWQDDARGVRVPVHERGIAYVFQEASLFEHLHVLGNLQFAEKRAPKAERFYSLEQVCQLLDLEPLLQRRTAHLSGGERQRVAIARALLSAPRLLLLDEPLAALDLRRRREILPYLERLHDELSIPVLYVSHAPDEVARLADYLVLLEAGQVVAAGPLASVLTRLDLPPAFADDAGVVLPVTLLAHEEDDLSRLGFAGGELLVARRREPLGSTLRCRIHARDLSVALQRPHGSSILNSLPARIVQLADTDTPGHRLLQLQIGDSLVLARLTARSCRELQLQEGQCVWAQIKAVALLD